MRFGSALLLVACVAWPLFSANASEPPASGKDKKAGISAPAQGSSGTLAPLSVPDKPAYEMQCGADGTLHRSRKIKRLPPPSALQLKGLQILEREVTDYRKDALEFQGKLGAIVFHHFKDRERRFLTAIETEIHHEARGLHAAEDEAIQRFEAFVARYQGERSDPQATPDAMFRLAALYDQRGKNASEAELGAWMSKALRLYRDVAVDYPSYEQATSAMYYLGHAFRELGRFAESQQAFRALVCANRFQILPLEGSADGIKVQALPQDHDQAFWQDWSDRNPVPLDQLGTRGDGQAAGVADEEVTFRDPYSGCTPLPEVVAPGSEPRYLAEVWWLIGNHHLYEEDPSGGPYRMNRAVSAYQNGIQFRQPKLLGLILQRKGWAHFRQQRYRTAVQTFVEYLKVRQRYPDQAADIGDYLLREIHRTIASSLTYVDFDGAPPLDPYVPRREAVDVERDPARAEQELMVAISRVQDPSIIPQGEPWSFDVYRALADQFEELGLARNAIATLKLTTTRFPLHPEAPVIVDRIAALHDELANLAKPGSPAYEEEVRLALIARTSLARYVGQSDWTAANQGDLEAIVRAEELAKVGLNQAAVDHTNAGRAFEALAKERSDPGQRQEALRRAREAYALAAEGWGGYIAQDPNAPSAYDSRFWLAFSRYSLVEVDVQLGQVPSSEDVTLAHTSAVDVRDSNEGEEHRVEAASYVVGLADLQLSAEYQAFAASEGRQGLPQREQLTFKSVPQPSGTVKEVVEKLGLPTVIESAVCARDEYNSRVPLDSDPTKIGLEYALSAASYFFAYGQLPEARRRYYQVYVQECGRSMAGFRAWKRLVDISNLEENGRESRLLVDSKSCAVDAETRLAEESLKKPVKQRAAYAEAKQLLEHAEAVDKTPEREAAWRAAAAAYKVALEQAPERDEAPEAAMNGAYCYKQVGDYDRAIGMYDLFIRKYGDKKTLGALALSNKEKYEQRIGYLQKAEQALAAAYVLFFDYAKAAKKLDQIANSEMFSAEVRKQAARQALTLFVNLDDEYGVDRAYKRFATLGAVDEERAEADFLLTSRALKSWDPASPDKGPNRLAREKVTAIMDGYHNRNRRWPPANRFVVQAAYYAAAARRAAGSPNEKGSWEDTIAAFDRWVASAPKAENGQSMAMGTLEAGMAAEAEYTLLDQSLRREFDYDTGHHRYRGVVGDVVKAYKADAEKAAQWERRLQGVVDRYGSQKWATIAIARQGSVYDSLRTGLYNTRPPELKMFTAAQENLLRKAERSENDELIDQADAFRTEIRNLWRKNRDAQLERSDRYLVERYSTAVALARRYNLSDPALTRAIRRLAFMTEVVGDAKMALYMAPPTETPAQGAPASDVPAPSVPPPDNASLSYSSGLFLRMRPGVYMPPSSSLPLPLPGAGVTRPSARAAPALASGIAAFRKGDLASAKAQFEKASQADPKSAHAHYALGAIHERLWAPKDAENAYRRALAAAPAFTPARVALAMLAAKTSPERAAAELMASWPQADDKAGALTALSLAYGMSGRFEQATQAAQDALKLDSNYRPAMVALAVNQERARHVDLSLYTLEGILDGFGEGNPPRDARNAEARQQRGAILATRGKRGPAMADFEAALAVRPDLVPARLYLAIYMLEAGNAEGALQHLEAAVRFDPRNVAAHLALGDAYRLLGRVADARRELEWVISARPKAAEPHYNLGLLYLTSDAVPGLSPVMAAEKAIRHFEAYRARAARGGPDDVEELITRAKTKKAENEPQAAAGGKGGGS